MFDVSFLSQRLHRALLLTLVAQDALRGVLPFPRILVHLHIHRTDLQAFPALDALALVAADTQTRKITHRLQEHGYWTKIFTEGAVVAEDEGKSDAHHIIDDVAVNEEAEKDVVRGFPEIKEHPYKNQGEHEHDVPKESQLGPFVLRMFVGQQVKNHRRPAAITAPSPSEKQRPEYLGDKIVERRPAKDSGDHIEPKTFNLHILLADQAEENQHVESDGKLDELPRIFLLRRRQSRSNTNANADIGEVQQEEEVACCQPQGYGNHFKKREKDDGGSVFLHLWTISF